MPDTHARGATDMSLIAGMPLPTAFRSLHSTSAEACMSLWYGKTNRNLLDALLRTVV
jgi:hypothetical protein